MGLVAGPVFFGGDDMSTKVVHCKREKYDVYIGRPSIFGNTFVIGKGAIALDWREFQEKLKEIRARKPGT